MKKNMKNFITWRTVIVDTSTKAYHNTAIESEHSHVITEYSFLLIALQCIFTSDQAIIIINI